LGSPEHFDFDDEEVLIDELGDGRSTGARVLTMNSPLLRAARRELRWFHVDLHGRVPTVSAAPRQDVIAASQIAGWLRGLEPHQRGALVVRYDGRRWPVRLARQFGGFTSLVVRRMAMQRRREATETVAQAERSAVRQLLAQVAAAHAPSDVTPGAFPTDAATELRRLRRAAQLHMRHAETAYLQARGLAPCVAPSRSPEDT
jgi:hypothetical protein